MFWLLADKDKDEDEDEDEVLGRLMELQGTSLVLGIIEVTLSSNINGSQPNELSKARLMEEMRCNHGKVQMMHFRPPASPYPLCIKHQASRVKSSESHVYIKRQRILECPNIIIHFIR